MKFKQKQAHNQRIEKITYEHIVIVSVNPHHVKKGKEFKDNSPTKNDVKDALVIADMIKNGYYSPVRLPKKEYAELREYMYMREYLVKQLSSIKNRIHRWTDLRFPEFLCVFKTFEGKAALLSLQQFPTPQDVLDLGVEGIVATWKKHMKRHCGISYAQALVEQAQRSVGTKDGLQAAKMSLNILLEQYEQLSSKLVEMEQQIAELLENLPLSKELLKIPGIGLNMVAAIFAEAGDLGQYAHGRQLLRLAGLHLGR